MPLLPHRSVPSAEDQGRIVYRYDDVLVTVNPRWRARNRGSLLVFPIEHYENIFDMPAALGTPLQQAIRDASFALKEHLWCEGISTRQHNEPAGDQDVWHYHVHVFPRYREDDLNRQHGSRAAPADVVDVADGVRAVWRVT